MADADQAKPTQIDTPVGTVPLPHPAVGERPRPWHRGWLPLGCLGLGLIALVVLGYFGYRAFRGMQGTLAEVTAAADESSRAIVTDWRADELLRRAAPEMLRDTPPDRVNTLITRLAQDFGPLVTYDGAQCSARSFTPAGGETTTNAQCEANAAFQRSRAVITLQLRKQGSGSWQILDFRVASRA